MELNHCTSDLARSLLADAAPPGMRLRGRSVARCAAAAAGDVGRQMMNRLGVTMIDYLAGSALP